MTIKDILRIYGEAMTAGAVVGLISYALLKALGLAAQRRFDEIGHKLQWTFAPFVLLGIAYFAWLKLGTLNLGVYALLLIVYLRGMQIVNRLETIRKYIQTITYHMQAATDATQRGESATMSGHSSDPR